MKILVLDDDPTGSQEVHSCLLLLRTDAETLHRALLDQSPLLFILTNTRALPPAEARTVVQEVCRALKQALTDLEITDFLVVSRSDSTLRGHYPLETDTIAEELGPFDAHFLVPAFFDGGRITVESIHYLIVQGQPIPAHETEFARDSVFGYKHSYLPDYVAEKTGGRIQPEQVVRFGLAKIRSGEILQELLPLQGNVCVAVDSETPADMELFAQGVRAALAQGKRFLFRSAASLLRALANLPPQPVAPEAMKTLVRGGKPGAVIVGSHVKKTTEQLQFLLQEPGIMPIELPLERLRDGEDILTPALAALKVVYASGKTPVIFTSRSELTFKDAQTRLDFGQKVSQLLMDIIQNLPADLGFLISKGGITSHETLATGLKLTSARLLGQILPGCSVIQTPIDHPQFPLLPVVLFPGNVGDAQALALAYRRLVN